MTALPDELRELIKGGPLAHLSTINPDGSPQVSVIWIGLDGDDLVIAPAASGGMQSESAGILTGTEGYAKYDVIRDADGRQGMIYVYWDNPWVGVTHPRFATNVGDVLPDCDFNTPPGQSDFASIDTSLSFHLAPIRYGHTHGGGDVTAPGDLAEAFALGPPLGIVSLFGLKGINKDPVWEYDLRDGPAPFSSASSGLQEVRPGASRALAAQIAGARHGRCLHLR